MKTNIITVVGIEVNEIETKKFLTSKNWPSGLQDVIVKGLKKIPIRYFICDDSGTTPDDNR